VFHHRHLQPPPGGVQPPLRREPPVEHPVRGGVGQGDDVRGQVPVQTQRGDLELTPGDEDVDVELPQMPTMAPTGPITRRNLVFAVLFILAAMGLALNAVLAAIRRRVLFWDPSQKAASAASLKGGL